MKQDIFLFFVPLLLSLFIFHLISPLSESLNFPFPMDYVSVDDASSDSVRPSWDVPDEQLPRFQTKMADGHPIVGFSDTEIEDIRRNQLRRSLRTDIPLFLNSISALAYRRIRSAAASVE